MIQSGQSPTILQQLCSLPFKYFSDPRLTNVLFPTLMACCYNNQSNREILEQELSCVLLSNFVEVSFTLIRLLLKIIKVYQSFSNKYPSIQFSGILRSDVGPHCTTKWYVSHKGDAVLGWTFDTEGLYLPMSDVDIPNDFTMSRHYFAYMKYLSVSFTNKLKRQEWF